MKAKYRELLTPKKDNFLYVSLEKFEDETLEFGMLKVSTSINN